VKPKVSEGEIARRFGVDARAYNSISRSHLFLQSQTNATASAPDIISPRNSEEVHPFLLGVLAGWEDWSVRIAAPIAAYDLAMPGHSDPSVLDDRCPSGEGRLERAMRARPGCEIRCVTYVAA
jgi:hypothetical protein